MEIGIIIQARTGSTRLPRKVLLFLPSDNKITVLQHVVRRVCQSKMVNRVIVATSNKPEDKIIIKIALREKVNFFCGSEENVLERYYLCARKYHLDVIVRLTADCPCIDSEVIDLAVCCHLKSGADYTSNTIERTFPRGLDVEVFNFAALEKCYLSATKDDEKEHVTPYIYKTAPHLFKIKQVKDNFEKWISDLRLTLDTKEDYQLIKKVYRLISPVKPNFRLQDIIQLFRNNPRLSLINRDVVQKNI